MPRVLNCLAVAAAVACFDAAALTLGSVRSPLLLGRPMNLTLPVHLADGEVLERGCVAVDATVGERRLAREQVAVAVEPVRDASHVLVRLRTGIAIDEPVVELTVAAGCPTRFVRRFVLFTEPAEVLAQRQPLPADAVATAPAALPLAESVVADAARATAATPREPRRAEAPPRRGARAKAKPPKATRVTPLPRLEVDVLEPGVATLAAVARAEAAEAAQREAAAAASRAAQRVAELEAAAAARDTAAAAEREALAALRRELAQAQGSSAWWPWLAALFAGATVFSLGLAWRLRRAAHAPWWHDAHAQAAAAPADGGAGHSDRTAVAGGPGEPSIAPSIEPPVPRPLAVAAAATALPPRRAPVAAANSLRPAALPEPGDAPALTFDEQVDLEQQVEFLIVLGQEDTAVELLRAQLRRDGGRTPMPYLKLLEIHRQMGDRDAYERLRARFGERFRVRVPAWSDAPPASNGLADDDALLAAVTACWADARATLELLAAQLQRDETADTAPDDDGFGLPVFEDLLLLYQVAHELARHPGDAVAADVDPSEPVSAEFAFDATWPAAARSEPRRADVAVAEVG